MRNKKRAIALVLVMCMLMLTIAACTAVQVSGKLVINADGSGSRQIVGQIAKTDDQGDGYGSAYYYFKLHGADLQAKLQAIYAEKVPGSADWLQISVDDSGDTWEVITISFDFASIDDYTAKLKSLAFDEAQSAGYADPTFVRNDDGTFEYKEPGSVMNAIFKSLQMAVMADDTAYDPACTKDGVALNTAAGASDLEGYGVEIIKPENGDALTIQVDGGEVAVVPYVDGVYTFVGGSVVEVPHETTCVLHYNFDESLANGGTAADNDLVYGVGSTAGGPVYEDGMIGKAIKLDGATYLASPNKGYSYNNGLTISFYYRMDAYTETDTGANMIIVPAGLGALGAGVIDVEFIKDSNADGIQLLGKMNSADWLTQDKLYSEEYYMESRLNQWHHYALVFSNEYDENGEISDAFVYMYIDGKLATRSRLSVAAGLAFSLGQFDDGSFGEPNGGFNVGGYYEAEIVKRACTGALDELMIFDGALSEEEINSLCYTVKVANEYDPDAPQTEPQPTEPQGTQPQASEPQATQPQASEPGDSFPIGIVIAIVAVLAVVVVAVIIIRKKKA